MLHQHHILEKACQVQEAALVQTHLQNCSQLEDFKACQIVQQLKNDQVHFNRKQQQPRMSCKLLHKRSRDR
eukprot:10680000-Ditylum_brightwellii.AAC.1